MNPIRYQLKVRPDGPVINSNSREESLAELRRLRQELGLEVAIELRIVRVRDEDPNRRDSAVEVLGRSSPQQ